MLAAGRAAIQAARSGVAQARAEFLPHVSVGASYGWHQDDDLALDDYRTWSATLAVSLPVFDSFRRAALYAESKAQLEAARQALVAQENEVLLSLRAAYLAVASSRERRRVADRAEES